MYRVVDFNSDVQLQSLFIRKIYEFFIRTYRNNRQLVYVYLFAAREKQLTKKHIIHKTKLNFENKIRVLPEMSQEYNRNLYKTCITNLTSFRIILFRKKLKSSFAKVYS